MPYQSANYANDFMSGFKGMQDVFSQQKKDALASDKDAREKESHALDMKSKGLDVSEKEGKAEERLRFDITSRITNLNGLLDTSNPEELVQAKKDMAVIGEAYDNLRSSLSVWRDPAQAEGNAVQPEQVVKNGVRFWLKDVANDPEAAPVAATLAKYSPHLLGKTFKDPAGREYKTTHISKLAVSEDGKMLALLGSSYTDTGEPYKDVPRTVQGSNSAEDALNLVDINEAQKKIALYHNIYDQAAKSGRSSLEVGKEMAAQMLIDNLPFEERKALFKETASGNQSVEKTLKLERGKNAVADEQKAKDAAKFVRYVSDTFETLDPSRQDIVDQVQGGVLNVKDATERFWALEKSDNAESVSENDAQTAIAIYAKHPALKGRIRRDANGDMLIDGQKPSSAKAALPALKEMVDSSDRRTVAAMRLSDDKSPAKVKETNHLAALAKSGDKAGLVRALVAYGRLPKEPEYIDKYIKLTTGNSIEEVDMKQLRAEAAAAYAEDLNKYLAELGLSSRSGMELVGTDGQGKEVWQDTKEKRPYVSAGGMSAASATVRSAPAAVSAPVAPVQQVKPVIRYGVGADGRFVPQ